MTKKSRAFSLIELSIVILIIGILIAGVTQSSRLLRMAKLTTAQTLTKSSPVAGIPGLMLWLEPTLDDSFLSAQSDDGNEVTQWNDINPQSSSKYFANHYYCDAPIYSASAGPNGLPSLSFDASRDNGCAQLDLVQSPIVSAPDSSYCCKGLMADKVTVFAVYSVAAQNSYFEIYNEIWGSSGYDDWYYYLDGDRYFERYSYNGSSSGDLYNASPDHPSSLSTSGEIISFTTNRSSLNIYLNGQSYATGTSSPLPVFSGSSGDFQIYNEGDDAYVSEIIVFDRVLKTEERQSIESYLGKKYGIKVAASTASSS